MPASHFKTTVHAARGAVSGAYFTPNAPLPR